MTFEYDLSGDTVTVGRSSSSDIVLLDRAASAEHARVVRAGGSWQLEDLKSTNGTFVNGQKVELTPLAQGDRIRIGTSELVYVDEEAAESAGSEQQADHLLQSFMASLSSEEVLASYTKIPQLRIDDSDARLESLDARRGAPSGNSANPPRSTLLLESQLVTQETAAASAFGRQPGETLAEAKVRLIQNVSERLVRVFDPQKLMDEIMSLVMNQTRADRGLVCLLDEQGQPVPIAASGAEEGDEVRISRTVLKRVLTEGQGVLVGQSADGENPLQSLQAMRVESTLCVPLWFGQKIIGLLSLDSTSVNRRFTREDLELLLAVAHQAAIGIEQARLGRLVAEERKVRDYLSKYLDDRIVEQISLQSDGTDPLAPTKTVVTVLFSDIVSFTKLSEHLDPSELADFMGNYLTVMTDVIFAHGGTIDKYVGDAIMALFGAPLRSENHADAAIRAALEMQQRVASLTFPGRNQRPLRIRIGINAGTAIVGNLGSSRRMEYTALGDTVNVASRLETFARPNEICVSDETYHLTGDAFDVENIGTIDVKNRAEPVTVYKVLRARDKPS